MEGELLRKVEGTQKFAGWGPCCAESEERIPTWIEIQKKNNKSCPEEIFLRFIEKIFLFEWGEVWVFIVEAIQWLNFYFGSGIWNKIYNFAKDNKIFYFKKYRFSKKFRFF